MKLEEEAMTYMSAKKQQFKKALREYGNYMEKYMDDNLHGSHELDQARTQLQSCLLWAEEAADVHGIK
jgi:hypothetical protein